jgi:hypothetical protein
VAVRTVSGPTTVVDTPLRSHSARPSTFSARRPVQLWTLDITLPLNLIVRLFPINLVNVEHLYSSYRAFNQLLKLLVLSLSISTNKCNLSVLHTSTWENRQPVRTLGLKYSVRYPSTRPTRPPLHLHPPSVPRLSCPLRLLLLTAYLFLQFCATNPRLLPAYLLP